MKSKKCKRNIARKEKMDLAVLAAFISIYNSGVLNDIKQLKSIIDSDFEIKKKILLNGNDRELSSEAILCLQSDDIITQILNNINIKISFFENAIKDIHLLSDHNLGAKVLNKNIQSKNISLQEMIRKQVSSVSQSSLEQGDIDEFLQRK